MLDASFSRDKAQAELDNLEKDHVSALFATSVGTLLPTFPFEECGIMTAEEITMGIKQAPTEKGKKAARGLRKAAAAEERKVEAEKGSGLAKGADRVEERSRSSDGKSSGDKQRR